MDIRNQALEYIREMINIQEFSEDNIFSDDYAMDSLDMLDLLSFLETKLNMPIDMEPDVDMTIGKFLDAIEKTAKTL